VTDTIKTIRGEEISGHLIATNSSSADAAVFKKEVLQRAFRTGDLSEAVTDECYLVEKLGHPIAFVEGNSQNIKITHPEDLVDGGCDSEGRLGESEI
jgi:2-C-methyl-D-erythritol 4-phosphate cytidylyltransferase